MKKILASILVLTMLVCCMSISAFADGATAPFAIPKFSISDVSGEPGETITVNVNISGNVDGIAAAVVQLTCDENVFTITRIRAGSWSEDYDAASTTPNTANGKFNLAFLENVPVESGVYATYTLKINEDAKPGEYDLNLASLEIHNVNHEGVYDGENPIPVKAAVLTVEGEIEPPVHVHDYSEAKYDENNHWNECPVDGEKANVEAHAFDDDADATCNGCEYTREVEEPHVHDYSEAKFDENGHWNECPVDGAKTEVEAHVFDDDADADCNVCEYTREVEEPHVHDYSEAKFDANGHWMECPVDGAKANEAAHAFDDDADATCNGCEYTREIAPQPPVHGDDDHDEPTEETKYESNGEEHWFVCSCGEHVKSAHEYVDDADTTCEVCGNVREVTGGGEAGGDDDNDDDDDKDDGDKDNTVETGDNTNLYIYMAICLFAAAAIVVTSSELKKNRG